MENEKTFYLEAYAFISGLIEYMNRVSDELSVLCLDDYDAKFKLSRDTVNMLNASITKFVNKWNNDEEKICAALKTIKEYYGFYCVTLSNSSPSMFKRDSKYITESINTSRLALTCKLKKIKEKL
jgi:hypothetical protein